MSNSIHYECCKTPNSLLPLPDDWWADSRWCSCRPPCTSQAPSDKVPSCTGPWGFPCTLLVSELCCSPPGLDGNPPVENIRDERKGHGENSSNEELASEVSVVCRFKLSDLALMINTSKWFSAGQIPLGLENQIGIVFGSCFIDQVWKVVRTESLLCCKWQVTDWVYSINESKYLLEKWVDNTVNHTLIFLNCSFS